MSTKLIHIVGGGPNQIPLIKKAKELGLDVLVSDMYANPPGRAYADFFEQINTTDIKATLAASRRYNIDAIATDGTDVAIPTVAYVAETLNLPGIGYETALCFTNKRKMRDSLRGHFSNIPDYMFFDNQAACTMYIKEQQYPLIIKPVNSQGSKGVHVLYALEHEKITSAFTESYDQGVLVEEYINGAQYSVEAMVIEGEVHNLAITEIEFFQDTNIARRLKYFRTLNHQYSKQLFTVNHEAIEKLGLKNGITHGEYRITSKGRIVLIEIACRGGGGGISSIALPYLTEIDTAKAVINFSLNKKFAIHPSDYRNSLMMIEFFSFKPGKIKDIIVDSNISRYTNIYFIDDSISEITTVIDSRNRIGYFAVTGESEIDIRRKASAVYECINIIYSNEKSIRRP